MAKLPDIAKAVVDELEAGDFSIKFAVKRGVFGVFEVEKVDGYRVGVWLGQRSLRPGARCGVRDRLHGVVITIQAKIDLAQVVEQADRILELAEEIEDHLADKAMAGCTPVTPDASILDDAQFLMDAIQRQSVYHHVIPLAYREIR